MKQIIYLTMAVMLLCTSGVANAQAQNSYLKVTHTTSGTAITDDILFNGGEISILNNRVDIVFAADASRKKTYVFDKILSIAFETRNDTGISDMKSQLFSAFVDEAGILHIQSAAALGNVQVYTVAGALVAQATSQANATDINLSSAQKGVYIVQVDNYTAKIVKQ
jgi:hypothetical protein